MRKLLLLLLLPALLFAGEFRVNKPKEIDQPAGSIDRVSKRTKHSKTFELGGLGTGRFKTVVGVEPIHYLDSTGVWQGFNFDAADTTGEYDKVVRPGKFNIEYSTSKPGKMRFEQKKGWIAFDPAFSINDVTIEYDIHAHGLKENIYLGQSSPNRLAWGVSYVNTHEKEAKGKGKVKDAQAQTVAQLSEFNAIDAIGKVLPLTAEYTVDSLIVQVDTAGAVWPIVIDPSVRDTASATYSGGFGLAESGASWPAVRDTTEGPETNCTFGAYIVAPDYRDYRLFYSFIMSDLPLAGSVDSARYYWKSGNYVSAVGFSALVCQGTFTGSPAASWFNDFTGWHASEVYTLTAFSNDSIYVAEADTWYNIKFNSAGNSAIVAAMGQDTLRVAMMDKESRDDTTPTETAYTHNVPLTPYIDIYYVAAATSPPGVTSLADTLYGMVVLTGEIDSIGGADCTVRGFEYNRDTGDTTTISEAGSFGVGEFSLQVDSLLIGEEYFWRAFATNTEATSYGAVQSFTIDTTGTGGTSGTIFIDGRAVDIVR